MQGWRMLQQHLSTSMDLNHPKTMSRHWSKSLTEKTNLQETQNTFCSIVVCHEWGGAHVCKNCCCGWTVWSHQQIVSWYTFCKYIKNQKWGKNVCSKRHRESSLSFSGFCYLFVNDKPLISKLQITLILLLSNSYVTLLELWYPTGVPIGIVFMVCKVVRDGLYWIRAHTELHLTRPLLFW